MIPQDAMSVQEASAYLAMDAEKLTRLARERSIPAVEVEGQWMFSKKSVDKWRQQEIRRK